MAEEIYITKICDRCRGSGERDRMSGGNPDNSCDKCDGTGHIAEDHFDISDLSDRVNDCLNKLNDIKELLTTT